jgi:hypothetical protein
MGAAYPAGLRVAGAGAGALARSPVAGAPTVEAVAPAGRRPVFRLVNGGDAALRLRLEARAERGSARARPATVRLAPGRARRVTVTAGRPGLGRLLVRGAGGRLVAAAAWSRPRARAAALRLGPLRLTRERGRVTGVSFALGAFERGDPLAGGTSLQLAESLVLELLRDGRVVRRLTPPGGARELMPAEYAYTLDAESLRALEPARHRFRAAARAPGQRDLTVALSPSFTP